MSDQALSILLIGLLFYRGIDLYASKVKLDQSLFRAARIVCLPLKKMRPCFNWRGYLDYRAGKAEWVCIAYRKYREKNKKAEVPRGNPRDFLSFSKWCRGAHMTSEDAEYFAMILCLLILLGLGWSLIYTQENRPPYLASMILAGATIAISLVISFITTLLEMFRQRLERM